MDDVRGRRSPGGFLALVVALWVPLIVLGDAPLGLPVNLPLAGLATACPLVAALVLVARNEGRGALRHFLVPVVTLRGARRDPVATALAVGLVPACLGVSAVVTVRSGGATPLGTPPAQFLVLTGLFLVAAMAEEAGWTAYLLGPLHRRFGGVGAALVIGVVSSALHLYGWSVQTGHGVAFTAGMAVSTVALRVVAVRLWERSGRGPGTSILLHASINVCSLPFAAYYDPVLIALLTVPVAVVTGFGLRAGRRPGGVRRSPG